MPQARCLLENWLLARWFMPVCFALFLVLRLLVLFLVPVEPQSDAAWYFMSGTEISQGLGYSWNGMPTAFWPVGYPAFLAVVFRIFGSSVLVAQLANLALGAGVFWLAYATSRRLFADESAARFSALLLTLYPNQIGYTASLLTETFYAFLILLAFYILMRRPGRIAAFWFGVILGFATLTKSQTLLFPLVPLALYLGRHRSRRGIQTVAQWLVFAYVGLFLIVLPWSARNYLVFDRFVLVSTNGGFTLLSGNNPLARGDYTPDNELSRQAAAAKNDELELDRASRILAVQWIRENPYRFLELIPFKIWRLWAPDGEAEWSFQFGCPFYDDNVSVFRAVRGLNQIYYVALLVGFAAAYGRIWRERPHENEWLGLAAAIAAYTTLISIIFSGQSRFHHFVMPWVIIYAGWAAAYWLSRRRRFDLVSPADGQSGP